MKVIVSVTINIVALIAALVLVCLFFFLVVVNILKLLLKFKAMKISVTLWLRRYFFKNFFLFVAAESWAVFVFLSHMCAVSEAYATYHVFQ